MFGYIKAARAARQARRTYELVHLEILMAENSRRLAESKSPAECKWCKAADAGVSA